MHKQWKKLVKPRKQGNDYWPKEMNISRKNWGADEIIGYWHFRQATFKGTIAIYSKKGSYKGRIIISDKSIHNENLVKEGEGLYFVLENGKLN